MTKALFDNEAEPAPKITALAPMDYALSLVRIGVLRISDDGSVWRVAVLTAKRAVVPIEPRRAENRSRKGYLRVALNMPDTKKIANVQAHRLVWTHLHGQIPSDMQINHKDMRRDNNNPSNLELVDASGNISHSYANGRIRPWSSASEWRPGITRMTEVDYEHIRNLYRNGMRKCEIRKQLSISKTHLDRILTKGQARRLHSPE